MDEELISKWRVNLARDLPALPDDYAEAKRTAVELSRVFLQQLGAAFAPRLNAQLHKLPTHNLEDCRELTAFCNAELADLNLRIRCPKTGLASSLVCDVHSQEYDAPRFRLQTQGPRGTTQRTFVSRQLPKLELMEDANLGHDPRRGRRGWRR